MVRNPENDAVGHSVLYGFVAAPVIVLALDRGNETIDDSQRKRELYQTRKL
jgi:hypothetical protein